MDSAGLSDKIVGNLSRASPIRFRTLQMWILMLKIDSYFVLNFNQICMFYMQWNIHWKSFRNR